MADKNFIRSQFKKDSENITFIGKYMEVYVSQYYFDKGVAELIGDSVQVLGILNFQVFADEEGKKGLGVHVLNIPATIITYPSGGIENRSIDLTGKGKKEDYVVLKYYNTDVLCATHVRADTPTFVKCMNIVISGKLPSTIPYNAVFDIWSESFTMNGVSFDIPDWAKEMIVAQIYRNPKDTTETFGAVAAKNPKVDMLAYQQVNNRELASANSVFNGIVFEDWDQMVVSGINNTKDGRKQNISPLEEVMRY